MIKHEELPDALNRMADGLDRQASTIPSSMPQHINKLLQDSAYLRKAATKIKETQSDQQGLDE